MKLAIFSSGRGSNARAIIEAVRQGTLNASIRILISNNSSSGIFSLSREFGIPAVHFNSNLFSSQQEYVQGLLELLVAHHVDFIALAGYMKMVPPELVARFRNRIVNIHPALLPEFGGRGMFGMHVHEAVIAAGKKESGATVHIVDEEYDRGPIVLQKRITVYENDTPEILAERVLRIEHEIYPLALRMFAENRVSVEGGTVIIRKE